jgi:beta-lactamase superfamily II metal-dependent hydrolase
MPVFSLEMLDARSGDALLVHYGTPRRPRLMVVDGGFAGTYRDRMKPRLAALGAALGGSDDRPLPIEHIVVSHLDDDHIGGIAALFRELRAAKEQGTALPYAVGRLWHNSFEDALGEIAGPNGMPPPVDEVAGASEAVAASVSQAREVRDAAELLDIAGNPPFDGLVMGPRPVDLGDGLEATVVGPDAARLAELQREWEEDVRKRLAESGPADAVVAAYVDESVPNLSSIVVHLRFEGRTMLLTGDGRGDHTLRGLEAGGLLDGDGRCHVDVLKVPHHGSDRDVDPDYFETIVADHYVISGNGKYQNPSKATLEMLTASQGDRPYTIHLTYPYGVDVLEADQAAHPSRRYQVRVRPDDQPSIGIDLGDPAP